MLVAPELASAKPYLLRAMYEWCCEQGLTPYVAVFVDEQVRVPQEFVRDNEITLNVGMDATNNLIIGNDSLEFKARFSGVPRQVFVPMTHILAIYGRENGQGMAFPISDIKHPPAKEIKAATDLISKKMAVTSSDIKKEKITPILKRVK